MATTNDEMQKSVKAAEQVSQKAGDERVTESQVTDAARSGARSGANIVVPENEAAHLAQSDGDNAQALPDAEAQAKIDEELEELFAEAEADEIPEAAQDVLLAQADSSEEEAMAEEGQAEGGEGEGDGSGAAGDGAMSAGQIGLVALGVAGVAAAAGSSSSSDGDTGESTATDTITSDTTEITGARDGEDVTFEVTSLPDSAISFDIGNTNSVTFNFTGDAVDGTLRLDADSSLNGDVVVTDGTLNVADADVSGVTSFEANSEVVITPSQLKALFDANEDFVISSNSTEESAFTLEKRTDADVEAYNELVSQGGIKVAGAGASTVAFVPLVSENFDGDADAASESAEQEIAAVSEGATFTLTTSLSLNANDNLPSEYSIDTSETNDYGALTVSEALAESNTYDEITEAATNAEELADINLAVWSIEDSAANIVAASEESYVTGASTISVTDSVVSASDFATLSGLDSYNRGDEVVEYTLAEALDADPVVSNYSLDADAEPVEAGAVTVDAADSRYADVLSIIDGANNSDELDAGPLFNWSIEDSAANIVAASEESYVTGADLVTVSGSGEISREDYDTLKTLDDFDLDGNTVANSAPTAEDANETATEDGETLSLTLNGSDVDVDDPTTTDTDSLEFAASDAPAGFDLSGDGSATFDPSVEAYQDIADGEDRDVEVDYTVTDDDGESASATLTITVTGVNDAPLASGDAVTISEDNSVTVNVLENDSDIDGDQLTISGISTSPSNGTAQITEDNQIQYTPDADFFGTDSLTYSISDGNGGTDTATITINIDPVEDVFRLTPATNSFVGTMGDDLFDATRTEEGNQTLNNGDDLDGGDGDADRLRVELDGASVEPDRIVNIEEIVVTGVGSSGSTIDLAGDGVGDIAGIQRLENVNSTEGVTFDNIDDTSTELSIEDVDGQSTTFDFTGAENRLNDTVGVEVDNVTSSANNSAKVVVDEVETLTFTALVNASQYEIEAKEATTVNFAGDANQTVTLATDTVNVSTFDGSDAEGDVDLTVSDQTGLDANDNLTITGGSGNDRLVNGADQDAGTVTISGGDGNDRITGSGDSETLDGGSGSDIITTGGGDDTVNAGDGNDTINVNGNLSTGDDIDGGEGTDTLNVTGDVTDSETTEGAITSIETLSVTTDTSGDETNTVDASLIGGLERLLATDHDNSDDNDLTIESLDASVDVELRNSSTNDDDEFDVVTIDSSDDGTGTLDLTLANTDTDGFTVDQLITEFQTVDLTVSDTRVLEKEAVTLGDVSGDTSTLNITGAASLTAGTTTALTLETINAGGSEGGLSAMTGDLDLELGDADQTITGGSGDDEFTFNADALASGDSIDGGAGTDTVAATVNSGETVTPDSIVGVEILDLDISGGTVDISNVDLDDLDIINLDVSGSARISGISGDVTINQDASSGSGDIALEGDSSEDATVTFGHDSGDTGNGDLTTAGITQLTIDSDERADPADNPDSSGDLTFDLISGDSSLESLTLSSSNTDADDNLVVTNAVTAGSVILNANEGDVTVGDLEIPNGHSGDGSLDINASSGTAELTSASGDVSGLETVTLTGTGGDIDLTNGIGSTDSEASALTSLTMDASDGSNITVGDIEASGSNGPDIDVDLADDFGAAAIGAVSGDTVGPITVDAVGGSGDSFTLDNVTATSGDIGALTVSSDDEVDIGDLDASENIGDISVTLSGDGHSGDSDLGTISASGDVGNITLDNSSNQGLTVGAITAANAGNIEITAAGDNDSGDVTLDDLSDITGSIAGVTVDADGADVTFSNGPSGSDSVGDITLTVGSGDTVDIGEIGASTGSIDNISVSGDGDVTFSTGEVTSIGSGEENNVDIDASGASGRMDITLNAATTDGIIYEGSSGIDNFAGTGGDDIINTNDGDDNITATLGDDTIDGGDGANTYDASGIASGDGTGEVSNFAGIAINLGTSTIATNTVDAAVTGELAAKVGLDLDGGTATYLFDTETSETDVDDLTNIDNVIGTSEDDFITGGSGDNTITGGAGADTLTGGAGDDQFVYGDFADFVTGNVVVDNIDGSDGTDRVSIADAAGFTIAAGDLDGRIANITEIDLGDDAIDAAGAYDITLNDADVAAAGVSEVDLSQDTDDEDTNVVNLGGITDGDNDTTTGGFTVSGGSNIDIITGTANDDVLSGGDGDDIITGGAGADTLTGGDGADTFVFSLFSDNGSDTIEDFEVGTDDLDVSASVTGGNVSGEEDVSATNAVNSTADDGLYVFADASQDITDAADSGVANFGNLVELADFLDAAIDSADGEEYLAVLNNGDGDSAKVVHVEGAADITFNELTVIGTVATDGAIDAADMTIS